MVKNQTFKITILFAVLITIVAVTYVYMNFIDQPDQNQSPTNNDTNPADNTSSNNISTDDSEILTIFHNGTQWNFNLSKLESMKSYTGSGRFINTTLLPDSIDLSGVYEYTGIRIKFLLEELTSLPETYTLIVTSHDNSTKEYSLNETRGIVDVYDSNGIIQTNETAFMIVAYMGNGVYYSEIDPEFDEIGPYRIVFVGANQPITPSDLWINRVTSIEINPQP